MQSAVVPRRIAAHAAALAAVAPDLGLAGVALITWLVPAAFPPGTMRWLGNVMVVEFVLLHAAGAVIMVSSDSSRQRWLSRAGLVFFYTAIAAWISIGINAWWPIVTFGLLLTNQFLPVLRDRASHADHRRFAIRWITATFIWIGATLLATFAPLPRFGLTERVVAVLGPGGDGAWEREPHRLVVAATLYFGIRAALEFREAWRMFMSRSGSEAVVGSAQRAESGQSART